MHHSLGLREPKALQYALHVVRPWLFRLGCRAENYTQKPPLTPPYWSFRLSHIRLKVHRNEQDLSRGNITTGPQLYAPDSCEALPIYQETNYNDCTSRTRTSTSAQKSRLRQLAAVVNLLVHPRCHRWHDAQRQAERKMMKRIPSEMASGCVRLFQHLLDPQVQLSPSTRLSVSTSGTACTVRGYIRPT